MATSPVRKLTSEEVLLVSSALDSQAKSFDRFAKSSPNPVIASEYAKQTAACRNLVAHFRNQSLDI